MGCDDPKNLKAVVRAAVQCLEQVASDQSLVEHLDFGEPGGSAGTDGNEVTGSSLDGCFATDTRCYHW